MVLPMPEVVLKMVALVFQGIEGLVFDFPTGAPAPHQGIGSGGRHGEVRHPCKMLGLLRANFPVFQEIDAEVRVGLIERHMVEKAEVMHDPILSNLKVGGVSSLVCPLNVVEQE